MFEQTTQFSNDNPNFGTMPSPEVLRQDKHVWNTPSSVKFTISRYANDNLINWVAPDSKWIPSTTSKLRSQITDLSIHTVLLLTPQLLNNSSNRIRLWEYFAESLTRGATGFRVPLAQALDELDQVVDEAQSEGYEIPSSIAIANAESIIKCIYDNLLHPLQVYPMPDGEVAIDITNGKGSSVLLLCNSDGGALCLVNIDGNQRRAHYSTSDALPDGFISEALDELQQNQES